MNTTLDYLKSNRKWLVPNIIVWGNTDSCDAANLMTEDDSTPRVVFSLSSIGGNDQVISFDELFDISGNSLPSQIANPVVMVIPRNSVHSFIVGRPSGNSFKIACQPGFESGTVEHGLVDLLIMEIDLP